MKIGGVEVRLTPPIRRLRLASIVTHAVEGAQQFYETGS